MTIKVIYSPGIKVFYAGVVFKSLRYLLLKILLPSRIKLHLKTFIKLKSIIFCQIFVRVTQAGCETAAQVTTADE